MAVRINVETCSSKSYVIKSINKVPSLVELYIVKIHGTGVKMTVCVYCAVGNDFFFY